MDSRPSFAVHFEMHFTYGGFLKWWYPTTMGFPTKMIILGCFGGTTISGNIHIFTFFDSIHVCRDGWWHRCFFFDAALMTEYPWRCQMTQGKPSSVYQPVLTDLRGCKACQNEVAKELWQMAQQPPSKSLFNSLPLLTGQKRGKEW